MLVGLQIRRGYIPLCVMPVMLDRWIDRQIDSSSAPFLVISKVPFGLQHTYPYTDSIYHLVSLNLPICTAPLRPDLVPDAGLLKWRQG